MISQQDKALLATNLVTKQAGPPSGATILSVSKSGTEMIVVNCAGFKRVFPDAVAAAKWLDIGWEYLSHQLSKPDMLFLVRRDHLDPWHSTRNNTGLK